MKSGIKIKVFLYSLLFFGLITFDQITKYLATSHLKGGKPFVIIRNVLELHYLDGGNNGAAWGILSGKTGFFIIVTVLVSVALIIFMIRIEKLLQTGFPASSKACLIQIILLVLTAGAIGNLIDRVRNGYVTDFIYLKLIDFPIFNVADCYVTVSAVLIAVICLFFLSDADFMKIFSFRPIKDTENKN